MKSLCYMCVILVTTLAIPAEAVINCFDYAFYRATGFDPRPAASPFDRAIDVSSLQCYLGALGYTRLPNPPRDDRDLRPNDVLILGSAHAGFVNAQGQIDHFIQVWGASGKKYDANALPPAQVYYSSRPDFPDPPGGKPSGRFSNHTLQQFINSAFRQSGPVYQWRKTGTPGITAQELIALEIQRHRTADALKTGMLGKAGQELAQMKRIASRHACLAQTLAEIEAQYHRLVNEAPANSAPSLSAEEASLLGHWNNTSMMFGNTAVELLPGENYMLFKTDRTYQYQAHTKGANQIYTSGNWRFYRNGPKKYLALSHTHIAKSGTFEKLPKPRESLFVIQELSNQRMVLFEEKEDPAWTVTLVYSKR